MADLSLIPKAAWREAQRWAEIVRPLAERPRRSRRLVCAAAAFLGLSERQTYELVRRCREAGGEGASVRTAARALRCHHGTLYQALLPFTEQGGTGAPTRSRW